MESSSLAWEPRKANTPMYRNKRHEAKRDCKKYALSKDWALLFPVANAIATAMITTFVRMITTAKWLPIKVER